MGEMGFIHNTLSPRYLPLELHYHITTELLQIHLLEALLLIDNLVKCCLLQNLSKSTAGKESTPEKTFQSCMATFLHGPLVLQINLQFFWFTWELQIYSSSHHMASHHCWPL